LETALRHYQLEVPEAALAPLDRYCRLLWDWNEKLNLTRHTDYDKFVSRDLLDSLELSRLLPPREEILDVGTGGGVPGVVLAILRPDLEVSLSESVGKKARVVEAIVRELDLPVAVHAERAEKILTDLRFDTLVARAVGPLWKMCHWFTPHWQEFGQLLAIKGPRWVEERQAARERRLLAGVELRRVAVYRMPGTDSESVILRLRSRRAGEAEGPPEGE
jgi:16S rRNA (guanine527-N7)-methyltransferase